MIFTLPYPPSANDYWEIAFAFAKGGRGKRRPMLRRTKAAVLYQNNVRVLALRQLGARRLPTPTGNVVVTVTAYRPRRQGDLDNTLKVLLDALKGVAYVDDAQVVEILARRRDDPENPHVTVTVEPVP